MKAQVDLDYLCFYTPLGWIVVAESAAGIAMVFFLGGESPSGASVEEAVLKEYPAARVKPGGSGLLDTAKESILAYLLKGMRLPHVPVDLRKGTPFDREIWNAIGEIPFGETASYADVAKAAGRPRSMRAAGGACGRNPVPLFVPCHRVIASNGKLGGFSGGLHIKRALLDLEKTGN
ncbi:MAG: methylated-DNA--[protein]-cysteine S-methyltransferase [Desulfobacteraceae bacterium]|nr:methylated-DNA--[protein]-cysteine S-methyltransferase [Desulfobacteraceae bacterium]